MRPIVLTMEIRDQRSQSKDQSSKIKPHREFLLLFSLADGRITTGGEDGEIDGGMGIASEEEFDKSH